MHKNYKAAYQCCECHQLNGGVVRRGVYMIGIIDAIRRVIPPVVLGAAVLAGCSENENVLLFEVEKPAIQRIQHDPDNSCYIAIDIDDVFQPNWDRANNMIGDVKMNRHDVDALVTLSSLINDRFPLSDFQFSLGYNSGFFESDRDGDTAFLEYAASFAWFNHLPNHEHVESWNYSVQTICALLNEGAAFALEHGLGPYMMDYIVTPKHEGLWPPYDPLYEALDSVGITRTSTECIQYPALYHGVCIIPRVYIGVGSGDYADSQVSEAEICERAIRLYNVILKESYVVIYSHQANFARDRLANRIIEKLTILLELDTGRDYVFSTAHDVVTLCHESL